MNLRAHGRNMRSHTLVRTFRLSTPTSRSDAKNETGERCGRGLFNISVDLRIYTKGDKS
jgi:hypothetical protein